MARRILLTAALPYANSDLHLGHVVEHVQCDVWARFQRMQGHEVSFVCADDTHGTPIMLAAKKAGISPEEHIAKVFAQHQSDFVALGIHHDHYGSTNSKTNQDLCDTFFERLSKKGHLHWKSVEQLYCNFDKMFLPDRFVKGTCPNCKTTDQYGDNCESCGATYTPAQLLSPRCSECGKPPELRSSDHLLFQVGDFQDYLKEWIPKHTAPEVANKMMEWFSAPLRPWDISRDEPYFGFPIPGKPGKFFYVWVDAPMGYVSATKELCQKKGWDFSEYWEKPDSNVELYHVIGKDIVYFHTLFWPAFLKAADFRSPERVLVHGFLTVNGQRMSKSRGTQIQAKTYLKHLPAEALRFYLCSKMNSGLNDFDFDENDFLNRVNAELLGKITNLASRSAQLLSQKCSGELSPPDPEFLELCKTAQLKAPEIAKHFEDWNFAKALQEIRDLAQNANRLLDTAAPWKETNPQKLSATLSGALNLFRLLTIYLQPVLPDYAKKVSALFKENQYTWTDSQRLRTNGKIESYQHLMGRLETTQVKAMMKDSQSNLAPSTSAANATTTPVAGSSPTPPTGDNSGTIGIEDFSKVDLRIAKIVSAEAIEGADKLLRLKVDLGPLGERQIIAGIKAAYSPEQLVGRLTLVVANLAPRKMKFGVSEGMVLAAGNGGAELFLLTPAENSSGLGSAKPGDKVK